MHDYDTSTTEGFCKGLNDMGFSASRFGLIIKAPESTVKQWMRGKRPVHPTAAVMLDCLLMGWRPNDWHMTGPDMKKARLSLGLSERDMSIVLDCDVDVLQSWEQSDDGAPHFVSQSVRWLLQGMIPPTVPGPVARKLRQAF